MASVVPEQNDRCPVCWVCPLHGPECEECEPEGGWDSLTADHDCAEIVAEVQQWGEANYLTSLRPLRRP